VGLALKGVAERAVVIVETGALGRLLVWDGLFAYAFVLDDGQLALHADDGLVLLTTASRHEVGH
jgi:hypothetical protein